MSEPTSTEHSSAHHPKTTDQLSKLLGRLEQLDGKEAIRFTYTHARNPTADRTGVTMEIRSLRLHDPLEEARVVVFGLWHVRDGDLHPVGVFTGTEHVVRGVKQFISGSRPQLKELRELTHSEPAIPEAFAALDAIHSPDQSGSDSAFEIVEAWRDGRLSQIFFGVSLELLHTQGYSRVILNDDKTINPHGSSVYTRFADGETYAGNASTRVPTTLTTEHRDLLESVLNHS